MKKAQSSLSAPIKDTEVRLENGWVLVNSYTCIIIFTILNQQQICIPTLGQQKDIGPGVTHRVKAVYCYCKTRNH